MENRDPGTSAEDTTAVTEWRAAFMQAPSQAITLIQQILSAERAQVITCLLITFVLPQSVIKLVCDSTVISLFSIFSIYLT